MPALSPGISTYKCSVSDLTPYNYSNGLAEFPPRRTVSGRALEVSAYLGQWSKNILLVRWVYDVAMRYS
jgi:hypothetical protein